MDHDKRSAIISWMNCIHVGPLLSSLYDLKSGRHFISIIKLLNNGFKDTDVLLENWPLTLKTFLVDHYGEKVKQLITFDKESLTSSEFEIAKIAVLLLCASIKCDTKAIFVNPLTKLAADTQLHIKEIIESVLCDWTVTQNSKLAEVLLNKMNSARHDFPPISVCNTPSDTYCYEANSVSPIKQLLQSPEVFHKLALREKDVEISRLKSELEAERISKSYLETDLLSTQETVYKRNSTVNEMRYEIMKLKSQYTDLDDCKTVLDNQQAEIQKLLLKCRKLDEKLSDYEDLKMTHNTLLEDSEKMEKDFHLFQNEHRSCDAVQKRCQELELSVESLTMTLQKKDEQILKLANRIQQKEIQLNELDCLYNETVVLLECAKSKKPENSGEVMSVVTDVIKLEDALKVKEKELEKCYCEIEQLKNEVHENHAMLSDVKIQLKTLEDVIEKEKAANIEATRALAALEDKSSQEKNAFQSEIASMQGEIDDLKQIMKNKDDELAKLKVLENLKVEMVELKKGMVEKERALLDLREEFSTMQVVVEKQQLELEESARAVVAQEDQWNFAFVMFHSEIQSKQKEVENLRTDLKVTMEELPKLELLRNEADEQIVELKKQKDSLDEDVKKYHEEILQLKLSCSVTEEELNKRGQELQNLKDIISDLNKEIHGKESTLNDLKEEYIKEKTLLCNELQLHADTNEQLQQKHAFECDELKKEIVKWETKTNQLLEEIQNKSSTISALEKLQSEHEHRIREILSERSELIKTYDDKVLDLETKNKCMKENVEGTESELMNLKSLFEKLKVNASDMMVKTEQTHELYIQKKQKLKSSLLEKEKEIEDLMKDLGRKEELHQELETRKSEIECSLVKLTSQVDSLKTDVCNYKQEIGKLNLELKSKEETLVMCEEELKTKQTTLADLELRLLEKDSEVKNLQDMNERQQTEILGYEKTIKREIIEKDQLMKNLEAATLENERVKEGYREKECLIKHIEETHLQDIQKKGDAVKLLQKHVGDSSAQISVLQLQNQTLVVENQRLRTSNHTLEEECKRLYSVSELNKGVFAAQMELTDSIKDMQKRVNESEKKHITTVGMLKEQIEILSDKYETAKQIILELNSEKELANDKLAEVKEKLDSKTTSINEVLILLKAEQDKTAYLKSNLIAEQVKNSQLSDRIAQLESRLNMHMTEANSTKRALEVPSRRSTMQYLAPSFKLHFDDKESNVSMPELRMSASSINSQDKDVAKNHTYSVIDNSFFPSIQFPGSAGSYFPCADEEGEMFNFSYLNDLKNGRCETDDHPNRISELQRRNTLCLPHLRSSYPVETQMVPALLVRDDDLKTGVSKEDLCLGRKIDTSVLGGIGDVLYNSDNDSKRKPKAIQPTYNKPGPPTPGKSSKVQQVKEKNGKTPTSLKKLLKRPPFITPNKSKATTPKRNLENTPPGSYRTKVVTAQKNIAFTIGLSPKVKLQPKSLVLKNQPQTSTPEDRRKQS